MLQIASAGHVPPILLTPDGRTEVIEVPPAPPLGAFGFRRCPEHEIALEPGATLLLYTDGLIERPGIPIDESIRLLAETVTGAAGAEEACLVAMDRMIPARGPRDDVAVIALRNNPVPDALDMCLPAQPNYLGHVRRMLARWLRANDVTGEAAAEITIAVSEACANAIEHAYSPGRGSFRVEVARDGDQALITVSDQGHWRPPRGENRGRGLTIMRAAMDDIDVNLGEAGTRVSMRRRIGHE